MKYKYVITGCLVLAVLLALAAGFFYMKTKKDGQEWDVEKGEMPETNPLKGFAAWGENYLQSDWVKFAYVPVYWSLIEPAEGVFDFAELENRCCFQNWRQDGVKLILRVVADVPGEDTHMDIPKWLYEKTGEDGDWYDNSYGRGFSPNYENSVFIEEHRKLIQALGERYGRDDSVAAVQLGSLGHWGEWHVNTDGGIQRFPMQSVTDEYVKHYLAAFDSSRLLLRRPYAIGAESRLGLYNDSFGDSESHRIWLSWIRDGYVSDQNRESLSGMSGFWKYALSGGEFATSHELSWYFSQEQFPETLELAKQSHSTFLGPNVPFSSEGLSETEEGNVRELLKKMGYCFGVTRCRMQGPAGGKDLEMTLTWENTGTAPMYANWPVRLVITAKSGEMVWSKDFDAALDKLYPGKKEWSLMLDGTGDLPEGEYSLGIGIVNPQSGQPEVSLAMKESSGQIYEMGEFRKR